MSDDLERTLHDSLGRHAAQLGRPAGEIDDVYNRVTRRRQRRRAVAGVGSLAIAAVGVLGIATLGGDGERAPSAGAPDGGVWSCTGYMGGDGVVSYYANCQIVDDAAVTTFACGTLPAPTTIFTPAVTAPPTTAGSPQNASAEACAVAMPNVDTTPPYPFCEVAGTFPVPAATTAPTMTTMLVSSTISTVPMTAPATSVPLYDPACYPTEQTYTVVRGDSVYSIAGLFGIDPQILANYNSWPDGINHPLFVGDIVRIPPGTVAPTTVPYLIDTTAVDTVPPATTAPPPTTPESTAP